jgi:hypothetical protein
VWVTLETLVQPKAARLKEDNATSTEARMFDDWEKDNDLCDLCELCYDLESFSSWSVIFYTLCLARR